MSLVWTHMILSFSRMGSGDAGGGLAAAPLAAFASLTRGGGDRLSGPHGHVVPPQLHAEH